MSIEFRAWRLLAACMKAVVLLTLPLVASRSEAVPGTGLYAGVLYSFVAQDGQSPTGGLVQASDGNFYGATPVGGSGAYGTVFRITPSGTLSTLYTFLDDARGAYPNPDLVQGADGALYGTTRGGGSSGDGIVFKITLSGQLSTLYSFSGSQAYCPTAGLILASDGNFYGTTSGTCHNVLASPVTAGSSVYKMTPTGVVTVLYAFGGGTGDWSNGNVAWSGLTQGPDGNFYGTTMYGGTATYAGNQIACSNAGCGTIYRITPGGTLTSLHSFNDTVGGVHPLAGLTVGADGALYGLSEQQLLYNGSVNPPTAYRITTAGVYSDVMQFSNAGLFAGHMTLGADGNLYGTSGAGGSNPGATESCGFIFTLSPQGVETELYTFQCTEGQLPQGTLVQGGDGQFYGVTGRGGVSGNGTVFKVSTAGALTPLTSFYELAGAYPVGSLAAAADGASYYGGAYAGGLHDDGTLFKITPAGVLTKLHDFSGADGQGPYAGMIRASDGNFYGSTEDGGAYGYGVIFRLTPQGSYTVLHSFNGADGAYPRAALLQAADGKLYGVAQTGGASGDGTVFSITIAGTFTSLHVFSGADGAYPVSALVQGADGRLYGTTSQGGSYSCGNQITCGTAYAITTTGALSTLYVFDGTTNNGGEPVGGLLAAGDGNLYGTTYGFLNTYGTVFRLTPAGELSTIYSFNFTNGANPASSLVLGKDGALYGSTESGGIMYGTVYRITTDGEETPIFGFNEFNGENPLSAPVQGSDGNFYGSTPSNATGEGDTTGLGVIYSFSTQPAVVFTASSLSFNATEGSSAYNSVEFTNVGNATLDIQGIDLSGSEFSLQNQCGTQLQPNTGCTIGVQFTPVGTTAQNGTLTVRSNAPGGPFTVALSGTVTAAAVPSIAPGSLVFNTPMNTTGTQPVTLSNSGSLPLDINVIGHQGVFTETDNCGKVLAAHSQCLIQVSFSAQSTNTLNFQMPIIFNSYQGELDIDITGTGVPAPGVFIYPGTLAFGQQMVGQASATLDESLRNNGDAELDISSIAVTGDFTQTNDCPASLPSGGSCDVQVAFLPSAIGSRSGTLVVNSNAPEGAYTVQLGGTGIARPVVSLTPASLSFGQQYLGTSSAPQAVTLANTGNQPLTISTIESNSGYGFNQRNDCGLMLAAGDSCTIQVSFAPTGAGAVSGQLVVYSNASTSGAFVTLSGTGVVQPTAAYTLLPRTLSFASQPLNTPSVPGVLTLTNTGNVALGVNSVQVTGDFTQSNNCPSSLAPGTACGIDVQFEPTAAGQRSGTLTVNTGTPGQNMVGLSGTGSATGQSSSSSGGGSGSGGGAFGGGALAPLLALALLRRRRRR